MPAWQVHSTLFTGTQASGTLGSGERSLLDMYPAPPNPRGCRITESLLYFLHLCELGRVCSSNWLEKPQSISKHWVCDSKDQSFPSHFLARLLLPSPSHAGHFAAGTLVKKCRGRSELELDRMVPARCPFIAGQMIRTTASVDQGGSPGPPAVGFRGARFSLPDTPGPPGLCSGAYRCVCPLEAPGVAAGLSPPAPLPVPDAICAALGPTVYLWSVRSPISCQLLLVLQSAPQPRRLQLRLAGLLTRSARGTSRQAQRDGTSVSPGLSPRPPRETQKRPAYPPRTES